MKLLTNYNVVITNVPTIAVYEKEDKNFECSVWACQDEECENFLSENTNVGMTEIQRKKASLKALESAGVIWS
jgi:hypothetical protein